jgi:5-formyltetrahydrofolate cyclo-ligase
VLAERSAKSELRASVRARRDAWPAADRAAASARLSAEIAARHSLAGTVMSYAAFGSEVDLAAVHDEVRRSGGRLLVPRVDGTDIVAVELVVDGEQVVSAFGIAEPTGPAIDPQAIDLVLVPGVAFDPHGGRLGYGAGYYDRFLPRLRPGTPRVGVCFALQVVDAVPRLPHDVAVDVVLTEHGIAGGHQAGD